MEQSILKPKRTEKAKELRRKGINSFEDTELQPREDGISNSLTSLDEDNLLIEAINTEPDGVSRTIKAQYDQTSVANFNRTDAFAATGVIEQLGRGFNRGGQHEECPTITRNSWENNNFLNQNFRIRKLTERECFRLMDVPDAYIDKIQDAGISRHQQYRMAGNSIVVNCLYLIFRNLFIGSDEQPQQLTLF